MKRVEYLLSGKNGLWYYHVLDEQKKITFTSIGCVSKQKCLTDLKAHLTSPVEYDLVEFEPQIHTSKSSVSILLSSERSHQTIITTIDHHTHHLPA